MCVFVQFGKPLAEYLLPFLTCTYPIQPTCFILHSEPLPCIYLIRLLCHDSHLFVQHYSILLGTSPALHTFSSTPSSKSQTSSHPYFIPILIPSSFSLHPCSKILFSEHPVEISEHPVETPADFLQKFISTVACHPDFVKLSERMSGIPQTLSVPSQPFPKHFIP